MESVEARKDATSYQIHMRPSDAIDQAILEAMSIRATNNPTTLTFTFKEGVAIVSINIR